MCLQSSKNRLMQLRQIMMHRASTPTRTFGGGDSSYTSRLTGATTPRGTPIQTIMLPSQRTPPPALQSSHLNRSFPNSPVPQSAIAALHASGLDSVGGELSSTTLPQYQDTILPFHLDLSEQLLAAAASGTAATSSVVSSPGPNTAPMAVQNLHLTKDQLFQLQVESSEYVTNLGLTLRTLFTNDNAKLRKTIANTNSIPMTFLLFRLQQQMLKLSGDYDPQRERKLLHDLATLLGA